MLNPKDIQDAIDAIQARKEYLCWPPGANPHYAQTANDLISKLEKMKEENGR